MYQPYPSNWPKYPPRDRVADWLETYAHTQELVVWTKSRPVGRPTYSKDSGKWTLTIDHDGTEAVVHPAHIVLATGTLGAPHIPDIDGRDAFSGSVVHSAAYKNAAPYVGKRVVVVGSGQSAVDICEEFAKSGIDVTMVQRSPTEVTDRDWEMVHTVEPLFPKGVPVEVSDFKSLSVPRGYIKKRMLGKEALEKYVAAQVPLHEKVKKAGVRLALDMPQILLTWERLGGTFC